MRNILAVTADLRRCSVAVQYNGQWFEYNELANSPTYLVKITQDLCNQNNIDLYKLDRIITASGPGSFTGIRTAQSFAKGLSFALGVPAVCASYFHVIKNMFNHGNDLVAIIQSEKNQVYYKDFSTGDIGVTPYNLLEHNIKSNCPLVGDRIEELLGTREFIEVNNYKDAKSFLSLTEFENNVTPLYINASS